MFITNKHNVNEQPGEPASMSSRLRELIPVTETLSILSGYFYFNGIPPLMEPIAANKNLKLRILVGLDVDRMGYELSRMGDGEDAQKQFLNSLRNFARSKMFDREACAQNMATFLNMMEDGRLAIRKTIDPNHAKLYIFEMNEKVKVIEPIRWITGSSNLTFPGLSSQNELNFTCHGIDRIDHIVIAAEVDILGLFNQDNLGAVLGSGTGGAKASHAGTHNDDFRVDGLADFTVGDGLGRLQEGWLGCHTAGGFDCLDKLVFDN